MNPDQQPLTKQDLREALDAALQPLIARQDAITHNLTDLRRELTQLLERIDNRTERTDISVSGLLMQAAGINKSLSGLERSESVTITQAAQQRAIDGLYAQLAELKRRLLPPQ